MIRLLLGTCSGTALAADGGRADASTVQRIHELEWSRSEVMQLATQIPGGDPETRADALIALGRLRRPDALEALVAAVQDPDPDVRIAAARALAWTPGAAPAIRARLAELSTPTTPAALARAEGGEQVALLEALGFQDQPEDVELLARAVEEPWPIGAAAARALGRLGVHKVAAVKGAAHALVARLDAIDPRTVEDVAWALWRIGLDEATDAEMAAVVRKLGPGTTELTRARLVKAAWPRLDVEARGDLFLQLATDRSRLVRVALFDVVGPEDVSADVLAGWLSDPDPWIRWSAIAALGRLGDEVAQEALTTQISRSDDPWEQAAAIRARGQADPAAAADRELPAVVRAAEVEVLADPAAWEKLALDDPEPAVRSAAVGALLEGDDTRAEVGARLLSAKDPAVREAALELVGRGSAKLQVSTLVPHLRAETDAEVLAQGLEALAEAGGPYPAEIEAVLTRAAGRSELRVRTAAAALARAAGRPEPPSQPPPQGERELVLPSGQVVKVERGRPAVASVHRIRRARVETSEGSFVIALDPDTAPLAVENFARLAEARFFDEVVFHRVVPGFVAQTGCPRGDGWGGPGWSVPDEVSALAYDVGAVGMARSADRDTGGSQWFVTTAPQPHLTGEYTRFGRVVEGMHVVKQLHPGSRVLSVTIDRLPLPAGDEPVLPADAPAAPGDPAAPPLSGDPGPTPPPEPAGPAAPGDAAGPAAPGDAAGPAEHPAPAGPTKPGKPAPAKPAPAKPAPAKPTPEGPAAPKPGRSG